jgi:uncharacterized protein with HEPN domain
VRPNDAEYLEYAARSIDAVLAWTSAGREHFLSDPRTQAAVLYRLQTLTQALRELTAARKSRYPDVPFRAMTGFRNVIVHDFLSLEMSEVWDVIENHLPALKPQVERMLADA